MGAFVGNKTSPFLRRRKGRIGRDVIATVVAPTFAGQVLYGAAGNYQASMCAVTGTDNLYQSGDFGQSAWAPRSYLDPNLDTGSSAAPIETPIRRRPFYELMDFDLWSKQCHFSVACRFTGVGGALLEISPDGRNSKVNFTAATFFKVVAWSQDGKCYFAAGEMIGASVLGRGNQGDTADSPIVFNYSLPAAGGSGCESIFSYQQPNERFKYAFITYNAQGAVDRIIKVLFMQHDGTWTNSGDVISPVTENCGNWLQYRNKLTAFSAASGRLIFGFTNTSPLNIFFTAGWSIVSTGNGSGIKASFQLGKRFYALSLDAPKIRRSLNHGITWEDGAQPPHATAQPTSVFSSDMTGETFILAADVGVNRCYRYRPYLEI